MIEKHAFGRTGHNSSRIIFGAAALGSMNQPRDDQILDLLLEYGVNHIDTAASYGDSELRLAPWLARHRAAFFLATKTGERTAAAAREQLHRSLERLQVDQVDLIQMHNLAQDGEWQTATGAGGALEALVDARDEGLVRFIGVTGHGTRIPEMHLRSLDAFDFDSVLLPYNYTMMRQPEYAADAEKLLALCEERNVAVQTIKAVALRRWRENDAEKHFSWYKPLRDPAAIRRAVHFVLSRPRLFLNTTSDATLLPSILDAAASTIQAPRPDEMAADAESLGMEPLFVRGVSDSV